jgi:3-oxoacyl-[acyl-carrier-protein] synthase-1
MDWGHAVVRLRGQFDAFAEPVVWYPAASFGDVGAASGLAGVCVAARAWERQYAPAAGALVVAASDGGERAAIALSGMRSR